MKRSSPSRKALAAESSRKYRDSEKGRAMRWKHQDARNLAFQRLIASHKDVPCADCGGRFPSICMDFDHREGSDKLRAVSGMGSHSPEAVRAEIAKCDVVCANCHRIRTGTRNVQREYWQSRRRGTASTAPLRQLSLLGGPDEG